MRMTATGVVRVSPQRSPFLVRPHNFLDHGSTWNACSCDESTVSDHLSFRLSYSSVPWYSLCPVDAIITRMGAYDNMFSNASTFKVELDEWYGSFLGTCALFELIICSCKILRAATPKSLVILDGKLCSPILLEIRMLTRNHRTWQRDIYLCMFL